MKRIVLLPLLAAAFTLQASAAVIYNQDFNGFATGTSNPDGWWSYSGPATTAATYTVQPSGVGGSQALEMNVDSSGSLGTDWYFYAGIGRSDIIAAGVMPADVTVALDIALFGATSGTPLTLAFNQFSGQTKIWETVFSPTLTIDGTFTHVVMNLGQGLQTGAWNASIPIGLNSLTFNNGGFGLDVGNRVILDNFQVSVIPEPSAFALLGLAGALMLRRAMRRF